MDKENKLNRVQWDIIDKFFKENPYCLVDHHIQTYNKFFNNDLFNIFKEKNPIKIMKNMNEETEEYDLQCKMFLGGKMLKRFIMENQLFMIVIKLMKHKIVLILCFQMKQD